MIADFVQETANAPGSALTINLAGAAQGRRGFLAAFAPGAEVDYVMDDGTQAEWGAGTVQAGTPNTLTRATVRGNTAGTQARLAFAGVTRVLCAPQTARVGWALCEPARQVSGQSAADFALPLWARAYRLRVLDLQFSTLNAALALRFSSDGGTTFLSAASYVQAGNLTAQGAANTPFGAGAATEAQLSAGQPANGTPWQGAYDISPGPGGPRVWGLAMGVNSTPAWVHGYWGGAWAGAGARMSAIRLFPTAGTFAGTFVLEGLR